ncbi:Cytochrome c oxidase subunit 6B [Smittium mucronatum]|uniref:Cytochrome c oxidase subunit 12, mitochondrial n=1 Tax=Smittium mucronatum TaxID=133383 RepID=A0A1R0GQM5_9FUNG|nr:Cytochrome c oxidase subunit 6B [Smittium mucronatum]
MTELKLNTPGYDGRFPQVNTSRRCYQNYVDYYRCILKQGEEYGPCKNLMKEFTSLCPVDWVTKWDEQREEGTFPFKLDD